MKLPQRNRWAWTQGACLTSNLLVPFPIAPTLFSFPKLPSPTASRKEAQPARAHWNAGDSARVFDPVHSQQLLCLYYSVVHTKLQWSHFGSSFRISIAPGQTGRASCGTYFVSRRVRQPFRSGAASRSLPPALLWRSGCAALKVKGSESQLYIQCTHSNLLLWKTICFSVLQSSEGKL